jgi:hypothetical protein
LVLAALRQMELFVSASLDESPPSAPLPTAPDRAASRRSKLVQPYSAA